METKLKYTLSKLSKSCYMFLNRPKKKVEVLDLLEIVSEKFDCSFFVDEDGQLQCEPHKTENNELGKLL